MIRVRHHKSSRFIVGRLQFGVVAQDMQDRCFSEYEENSRETPRQGQRVRGEGGCVPCAWGMGIYVSCEQSSVSNT